MLSPAQLNQFARDGYVMAEDILDPDAVAACLAACKALAEAAPGRCAWNERACLRGPAFRQLLETPALIEAAEQLLGPDLQLLALDLRRVGPGGGQWDWHQDVSFQCDRILAVNVAIYLQDTDEALGPLHLAPGSHAAGATSAAPTIGDRAVGLPAPAGAAIFHDAAIWHTASPNRSAQSNWTVFPFFGRYWIKRMDGFFTQPLPGALLTSANPLTRQLFGLGLRPGAPSLLGDSPDYNLRGEAGIDF